MDRKHTKDNVWSFADFFGRDVVDASMAEVVVGVASKVVDLWLVVS
jgi:hypothetical protein